ncbi:MAG: hypothetical protein WCV63_10695 [Negativicutes bacterium]|jgi:hypothetical protein
MSLYIKALLLVVLFMMVNLRPGNVCCAELTSYAIHDKLPAITEKAVILGFGGDRWADSGIGPPSYRGEYMTIAVAGHFGADLSRIFPDFKKIPGVLSFYLEPGYEQGINKGFEAGLSVGIQYRVPVYNRFDGFVSFSSGPYYASTQTETAPPGSGWCLLDAFTVGTYYHLQDETAISLALKLKHNSNGRLDWPMLQYNDWYVMAGYSWFSD